MLRRIEAVPVPLPQRGGQRAAHVFGEARDDVRGEHAVGGEDAVVADERAELAPEGLPREPVDHVAAVAAAEGDGAGGVDVGHVLLDVREAGFEVAAGSAAPFTVDGVEEGVAEAGGAGGVGQHDDVAGFGEDGGVPAGGPGVRPGGVGAAVDEKGEGVAFLWGEGRGPHDPGVDGVIAGAGEGDF